jgi:hypothetical protein
MEHKSTNEDQYDRVEASKERSREVHRLAQRLEDATCNITECADHEIWLRLPWVG